MNVPTDPSSPTRALADFAFGTHTQVADASRPLAWLSPEELEIDLNDPVARRFGDYELVEKIGQGGMGVVYRARQHGLERDVALKLLAAGPWASEEFVARFRREARSAARMQHPNIVEIFEFGHRDGLNYFSMRLIDGQSLAQKLNASGPLPAKEAATLLRTLAEAMDYAHRLGVLHLDLKPANVLLTPTGTPLIADFGLARRIDAGHDGGNGEISGTPSYMAPEQALLESHPLSASTDIYGLGAVLYECLVGRAPFLGADAQKVLERVVAEAPITPRTLRRDVPADLEAICLKCLEKEPAQRYASARELADDLGRFLDNRAVSVRPLGPMQRAARWARREPRVAIAVSFAFLALAVGFAVASLQLRAAEAARKVAEAERREAAQQRVRAETSAADIQ
jgi:serine/threonine protein kinase